MFLKLCALQTPTEALAAHAAGASAFGLLCGLTHRAEDQVTPDQARAIVAALPPAAETVLVTHLTAPGPIADLARAIGVRAVQAHGDLPPDGLLALRALLPGLRLIKAIHVDAPAATVLARARPYLQPSPLGTDAILLDSRTADRLGGTGRTHDWAVSRAVAAALSPIPIILAGGLTPDNVAAAIAAVFSPGRPAGVDVNSGVEHPATGAKDPDRMRRFVAAARAAFAALG